MDDVLRGDGLLRAIFESSAIGMVVGGADGRPRCANPALERLLGYTEAELTGKTFAELTHPDDVANDVALFREMVSGARDQYQIEKRYLRKDGHVLWTRVTVSMHRATPAPLIIGMIEDVSAARAAEARQRELVHKLGERVKELTALHRAARLLLEPDPSPERMLLELAALLPPAMQYPEITTACVRLGDATYATPDHAATPWMLTVPFRTADGRDGALEVAYRELRSHGGARPFLDEEDALLASLGDMIRSAIDRRHAEQALRDANERLNLALTTAGMAVWEWDVGPDVVRWSPQFARMIGREGTAGGRFQESRGLIHPDDQERLFGPLVRAVTGGADLHHAEFRVQRPGGGWRTLTGTARIVRDAGGRGTQVIAALIDISEQRALEEGLRQAQKVEALGKVAGSVAHDFNNLLAVVSAGVEMLREEVPAEHPWREIVEDLHVASGRGIALTRQLLAFARTESFQPAAVDLGQLVARFEPLLTRITRPQIAVRLELDGSAGKVWADPAQLEQVVMNLVVNARDAMPDGGVVTVSTAVADDDAAVRAGAPPGRYAVIAVRDTGGGIEPGLRDRIFEPFFTTKAPGKGTGLGLAVVRGVAKQWQGYVAVDSAPGAGATFRVLFPQLPA